MKLQVNELSEMQENKTILSRDHCIVEGIIIQFLHRNHETDFKFSKMAHSIT